MEKSQVALLLGLAAAFDQRTTGESDVEAWHLVLGDLEYGTCRKAIIQYYKDAPAKRVMPAHIRERVHGTPVPPRWPMTSAGLRGLRGHGDGLAPPAGGDDEAPSPPTPEYLSERRRVLPDALPYGAADEDRVAHREKRSRALARQQVAELRARQQAVEAAARPQDGAGDENGAGQVRSPSGGGRDAQTALQRAAEPSAP
jgi:hypothetical protein